MALWILQVVASGFNLTGVSPHLALASWGLLLLFVIVTGGAQGIGRAVVERVLVSGGKVSIWDRDRDVLDRVHGAEAG